MFLPKNKYKVKSTTNGFVDENGKPYVGEYIETQDGQFFSGSDPLLSKSTLLPVESTFDLKVQVPNIPLNLYIIPTPKDYLNGFFQRYFIQETKTKKIVEVNSKIYNAFTDDNSKKVDLRWRLVGFKEDTKVKGYPIKGVRTQNTLSMEQASTVIPEIKNHITDMLQFTKLL